MKHAYLLYLDTMLRTTLHNQTAKFPLSAALFASSKMKYSHAIGRTIVRKGKISMILN